MAYNKAIFLVVVIAGFLLRFLLLSSPSLSEILENRIEISTPLSSWKRAVEGVTLQGKNINPYIGDVYHESALLLYFCRQILLLGQIDLIFSICDVLTALLLAASASIFVKVSAQSEKEIKKFPENVICLLLQSSQIEMVPFYVASVYLFCPYAVASCCGKSTVTFQNLIIALFLLFTALGHFSLASVVLGILSYHSLYHSSLIAPLILYMMKTVPNKSNLYYAVRATSTFLITATTVGLLLLFSYHRTGSWEFINSTYGFTLSVPDLTPNIGLFWYFFTEMFEHFRIFFLWTFQLNAFIYTIPLAIRFRDQPMLLLFVHLVLIALFKSYPCVGDVALYLALLPMFQHLFVFMRQGFLVGCVFVSCSLLAPTLWHLWLYSGSANANFYFSITLVFNTGQIFLLTDMLSAFIKREYYLENGIKRDPDGQLTLLRLQ